MYKLKLYTILFLFIGFRTVIYGQEDRFQQIENQLDAMIVDVPGLETPVEYTLSGISAQEFLTALGISNNVNINVDPSIDINIYNSFTNVTVSEVILFMAKKYDLQVDFIGSIISISKYEKPVVIEPFVRKIPEITYDTVRSRISMNLSNDSLFLVTQEITKKTGQNIVYEPGLGEKLVNVYLEDLEIEDALKKLAFANELELGVDEDNVIQLIKKGSKNEVQKKKVKKENQYLSSGQLEFNINSTYDMSVKAKEVPINTIIQEVGVSAGVSFFLLSEIDGNTTFDIKNASFDHILTQMLKGTKYTYYKQATVYYIGERTLESIRQTHTFALKHRSVENLIEVIPNEIKDGLSLNEFPELNSIILTGSMPRIIELETFLAQIDKPVPVVIIEVMIVDYSNTKSVSTGIQAGIGESPVSSGGMLYPGVDYTLNSQSINNLIDSFNGFGSLNLGKVTPNFFLSIKALEDQGIINVRSTPKLSTLNGHEATLTIGNTEWYVLERNQIQGNQSPVTTVTRTFNSVQASLSITIKPFVSQDEQVTLDIQVNQSDFTARISPEAPPGSVTREFTSLIRVKNGDMILLGGLEEKSSNETGSGVPLLSRIPIIKWFFSSRTRANTKTKLNIFIKPTIIY